MRLAAIVAAAALALAGVTGARANEPFYAGKTVRVLIPADAGGVYGLYAQVAGPHLRRHVPGNPEIVPQYMPGGGGITAANHLANVAPADGTVLAMPHDSLVLYQMLRPDNVKYDVRRLAWIGTIGGLASTISVWHTSPVKSVADATKTKAILGATGRGSYMYMVPRLMNVLLGTQFEMVTGYKGVAEIDIAMERGEVQGRGGSWLSWKSTRPDWMQGNKIVHLVQIGHRKADDLPDVPLLVDLGRTEEERQMYRFVSSIGVIGRGLVLPGGVPAERVALWREAFAQTIADPAFLADAKARLIDVEPIPGAEVERAIAEVLATPQPVVERLRSLIGQ